MPTDTSQANGPPEVARLYEINAAALAYWADRMGSAAATRYLNGRGLDIAPIADTYAIGYARSSWTTLTEHLHADGHSDDDLLAAGVSVVSRSGSLVDRFRARVIFPIRTAHGDIAGFIGRRVSADQRIAKYLNTSATVAFAKGKLLYGLHESLALDRRQPVIVEGPTDVLAVAAMPAGQDLAPVAACGVAFTRDHANAVTEFCRSRDVEPVVAYDGDTSGRTAAIAAGELLRTVGLDPYVTELPDGSDPASTLASGADLAPFRRPPTGAAIPLAAAVANRIVDEYHSRWRPQWPETKTHIARAITRYLATYSPETLPAAAGQAFTVAANRAGVSTAVLLAAAHDLTAPRTPVRTQTHEPITI